MNRTTPVAALLLALAATACAHAPETRAAPADYSVVATEPSPNARFYADCIAEAVAANRYGRAYDESTEMVLFTCTGTPARAFYEALGPWSAEAGSEASVDGRTFRSTNPVQRNLFGVDHCSTSGAGDYRCVVSLNAGAFLRSGHPEPR